MRVSKPLSVGVITAAYSLLVVTATTWIYPNYFMRDDALNEFLPFLKELSRLLFDGQAPTLTTSAFAGGNFLVDFHRSLFNVTELVAVLGWQITDSAVLISYCVAVVSTALLFLGTYLLAKMFIDQPIYRYLFAMTVTTLPVGFTMYLSDWWNAAGGMIAYVWFLLALAWCWKALKPLSLLCLFVTTWLVFVSGWPHSMLALLITVAILAVWYFVDKQKPDFKLTGFDAASILAVGVLGAISAFPTVSEYLALGNSIARVNSFGNPANFGVPSIGQLMSFVNPVGFDFWGIFNGYQWWPLALGFVSLLFVFVPFLTGIPEWLRGNTLPRMVFTLAIVFLLATQLPSQLGPIRWPFRFVEYWQIFLAALLFLGLDQLPRSWSLRRYAISVGGFFIAVCWSVSRTGTTDRKLVVMIGTVVLILLIVVAITAWNFGYRQRERICAVALVICGIAVTLLFIPASTQPLPPGNLPSTSLAAQIRAVSEGGYLLDATAGDGVDKNLHASRYLLYDIKIFNGYDPNEQSAFVRAFKPLQGQNYLDASAAKWTLRDASESAKVCRTELFRISAIMLREDQTVPLAHRMKICGFAKTGVRGNGAVVYARTTKSEIGTVSYADAMTYHVLKANDQRETISVENPTSEWHQMFFARQYWPGYFARIDGKSLKVLAAEKGNLVSVSVPPHTSGTLELHYATKTWPWAWWATVLSVGLLALILFYVSRTRRSDPETVAGQ